MKKLMLAMSGGVDSSVALLLLREQYELQGATMKVFDDDTAGGDARKLADVFGVPHRVFDLREQFKDIVAADFADSYIRGETPNPCVVCNMYIKFGAFYDEAKAAFGTEGMATGHYARVEFDKGSRRYLLKKANSPKDQSYVLYGLTQEQLSRVIFPLGNLDKGEVRELARHNALTNSGKPDSQDICFIPDGDYAGYIERFTGREPTSGDITDKDGNILGRHSGIIKYTIGQRKGMGLAAAYPLYVIGKDAANNRIIAGGSSELFSDTLTARQVNWIAFERLTGDIRLHVRTRYAGAEQPCIVIPLSEDRVMIKFDNPQRAVTPGQSAVFYDGDIIIGGGTIESGSA